MASTRSTYVSGIVTDPRGRFLLVNFRRSRKPAEKAHRRAAILRAAADLVEEERLEDVSLNA